ncbi:hypothetical protein OVA07_00285 [Novosphingobium sp. SL115]|uniref:hypothetical protein n=1 Tax=Novosphingobium sp. SL115 TaxID=2995150 RepID=UPI002274F611|nr:hypothetical protein [Novosphingobium sp. SL115]MCY1669461.1 hypothetical protein [Novosphingobium sp. SL115]
MIKTEKDLAEPTTFRELLLGENACDIACVLEGTFQQAPDALYLVAPDGRIFRVVSDVPQAADCTGPVLAQCRRIGTYVIDVESFEAKLPTPKPPRRFMAGCTTASIPNILKTLSKALATNANGFISALVRLRVAGALISPAIEKLSWKPAGSGRDHQSA